MSSTDKVVLAKLLAMAKIELNGHQPWDLRVLDERAYGRILREQNLGLGECYMDGLVECDQWDELVTRILSSDLAARLKNDWRTLGYILRSRLLNLGSRSRAFHIGQAHYDIGNDLYERMLDQRLVYTCGYWKEAADLNAAQEAKLDLVCRKLGLVSGMTVLDIGCGWGSFAGFAAERYGVKVTGISVSREQVELARRRYAGLPVEFLLQDYRDTTGQFDRIVSLGMFEHVVYKNYRTYMEVAHRLLKDDGMFLLHTIGGNTSQTGTDPWIDKYIFPNSMLPSVAQIGKSIEGLFVMEDWHNFGADYDRTLMAWFENFDRRWPELAAKYGDRFYRMWRYYLQTCAGTFRSRHNQLWQVVLSKSGVPGGYRSIR